MTTYPLALPTATKLNSVQFSMQNSVAIEESPFTFAQQAQANAGQRWSAGVSLPPMRRATAETWIGWLASLRGRFGSFYLGDPLAIAPLGTATTATLSGSSGDSDPTITMTGTLLAGDWFHLVSGTHQYLHKVLADQSGNGTINIWPALRINASSAIVYLLSPQGTFRLGSNDTIWNVSNLEQYGISFDAVEVITV